MNLLKKFQKQEVSENYDVIILKEPSSVAAEAYRRIKLGIAYSQVDKKVQVIQVCSSVQGEGKTTALLNIAATYAEDKKKVIVVDLDFRRPKVHRSFHVENKNGVTDVLAGAITLDQAIKSKEEMPFDILNRGSKAPYPTTLLASNELASLIEELKGRYDIILLDCPPILAVSDCLIVAPLADGAIFVVSQKVSDKGCAKDAIKELKANNVNLLGCIFTNISKKISDYSSRRYHYYYQSNYGSEK